MSSEAKSVSDLPIQAVNSASPIPIYHQIEQNLKQIIEKQYVEPGDLLPPEMALSKAYGVSRQTVRVALKRLEAARLISRQRGRGTVVIARFADRIQFHLDRSFTRQIQELGRTPSSLVLDAAMLTIDDEAPTALQQHRGEPAMRLVRLRFGDDQPIGYQHTTIVTSPCPDLIRHNFNRESLYEVLSSNYDIVITRIDHVVTATTADATLAELLKINVDDPLLVVKTTAFANTMGTIEHTISTYRADVYEYRTSITNP